MSDVTRRPQIYRPAWWIPGRHAQTLWGKFARRTRLEGLRTERWSTPDGDFIDMVRLDAASDRPRLFILHGLEGTTRSHYVGGLFEQARARGWGADLLVFRGCGSEPNRAARFYHSGETDDLSFAVSRVLSEHAMAQIALCGVSLGGNVLLKWLGEMGDTVPARVSAAATISVPYDLERGSRHISRGFARVYERHFMRTLRRKAREKLTRYPGLFDDTALQRARTLYQFDDIVTAPVHGFRDARDYYTRSSSIHYLSRIRVPTLLLSARDDPFLPSAVLDDVARIAAGNRSLTLEIQPRGGHVGFVGGRLPWRAIYYGERRVVEFLAEHVQRQHAPSAPRP